MTNSSILFFHLALVTVNAGHRQLQDAWNHSQLVLKNYPRVLLLHTMAMRIFSQSASDLDKTVSNDVHV